MSPTATRSPRFGHEIGFYSTDDEFLDLLVPFATDGLAEREPVVLAYDPYKTDLLRTWLPADEGITYLAANDRYTSPGRALSGWRGVVEERLDAGVARVRIAGDLPHPGRETSYAGWDRYEAAVDAALGPLAVWGRCCYDTRITPPEVLARADRHHEHRLDSSGASVPNPAYLPARHLREFLVPPPDPLEESPPVVVLLDPTPRSARAVVDDVARWRLGARAADDLRQGVSEAVGNGLVHGRPPLEVRVWADDDAVVVHVHDGGAGPADPLVGLVPAGAVADTGRGLWLTHQLDLDVALLATDRGFTVRLVARQPTS